MPRPEVVVNSSESFTSRRTDGRAVVIAANLNVPPISPTERVTTPQCARVIRFDNRRLT